MNQRTSKFLRRAADVAALAVLVRDGHGAPSLAQLKRVRRLYRRRWNATPRNRRAAVRRSLVADMRRVASAAREAA